MPAKKTLIKRHKRRHTKRGTNKTMLMGGAATYNSDSLAAKYASCGSADRHNLQSGEANLDLINGGGVVPAGQTGGATNGSCPGNGKLLSFKDYTNNVAALLGVTSAVPEPSMQMGGGYSIDPSAGMIGGQPARVGYSDCCPPVSLEGRLLMGSNSGAVCGQQAGGAGCGSAPKQLGGAGCGSAPKQLGGAGCGSAPKQQGGKKHRKSKGKRQTQKKSKKQRGGDSVPAAFPAESHAGVDGDFSDQGPQLHYDARQPFWDATAR